MIYDIYINKSSDLAIRIAEALKIDRYTVALNAHAPTASLAHYDQSVKISNCKDVIILFNQEVQELSERVIPSSGSLKSVIIQAYKNNNNIIPVYLPGFSEFPEDMPKEIRSIKNLNGLKFNSFSRFEDFYIKLKELLTAKPEKRIDFHKGLSIYTEALILKNSIHNENLSELEAKSIETRAFHNMLKAVEMNNEAALSEIEEGVWSINLKEAISSYKSIFPDCIKNIYTRLYTKAGILLSDPTLDDSPVRGHGMESMACHMMTRAIRLGYPATLDSVLDECWMFLKEEEAKKIIIKDFGITEAHLLRQKHDDLILKNQTDNVENKGKPIFISYKRENKKEVFKIVDAINTELGAEVCWIDLDGIESDAIFVNVIMKAINNCKVFLFMYSKEHAQIQEEEYENDWTIREISFAQKKKKRIVFANIDGAPLSDWFEFLYSTKQQIDMSNEDAIQRLHRDLKKWIN